MGKCEAPNLFLEGSSCAFGAIFHGWGQAMGDYRGKDFLGSVCGFVCIAVLMLLVDSKKA